jgi:hypothetical protein
MRGNVHGEANSGEPGLSSADFHDIKAGTNDFQGIEGYAAVKAGMPSADSGRRSPTWSSPT